MNYEISTLPLFLMKTDLWNKIYTAFLEVSPRHRHRAASGPTGTGTRTNRPRPALNDTGTDRFRPAPDRSQLACTGTSLGPVCAGPYRLSNGMCGSVPVPRRDSKKRCKASAHKWFCFFQAIFLSNILV